MVDDDLVSGWVSKLGINGSGAAAATATARASSATRAHEARAQPPPPPPPHTQPQDHSAIDSSMPSKLEQPYFLPQLWLARRTHCVELLRAHGVRSVADLGCGQGAIISLLTIPSDSIDDFPSLYPPPEVLPSSPSSPSVTAPSAVHRSAKLDTLRRVPRKPLKEQQLHLTRLVGVDIDKRSLARAVEVTAPPPPDGDVASTSVPAFKDKERWEDLSVDLYEGGVEVYNPALERIEAMVSSEVIEHMTPSAFTKFGSTVLGLYGPRLLIVTTPNHEFNPYFMPSSAVESTLNQVLDPTARTNRRFRDDDHKFEWTRAEFEEWATQQADEWDYQVKFSGVGSLANYFGTQDRSKIPFPPPSLAAHPDLANAPASLAVPDDPSTFYSTQVAVFTKIIPNEAERSPRSHKPTPLPFFYSPSTSNNLPLPGTPPTPTSVVSIDDSGTSGQTQARPKLYGRTMTSPTPHHLVQTHLHHAHPSASVPAPPQIILRDVRKILRTCSDERDRHTIVLNRLWHQFEQVREACGGIMGSLIEALLDDDRDLEFEFELIEGKSGDEALKVVWKPVTESESDDERGDELTPNSSATPLDDGEDDHDGYDQVDEIVGGWQNDDDDDDNWSAPPASPPAMNPLVNGIAPHTYAGAW
ncbi:hypothetical protein OIV83_002702 [Microbotryomycetes sp. JL201]|nr:hypothetical protein OIV83_002702 [Microbotryomycetes sp. JL201]